ncbi:MAG: DNA polymerase III subunit alpha [Clostridia bacterium]|nr:DNA polymerase III subunit alpha [Clostridia bacterium]
MFAHLHLHTEYSLLDGACKIKELMPRLKEMGMTSCAVTDHGVMYGVVDFYRAAKEAGIHPVIGCEVYVCPDMDNKTSTTRDYSHLILLCENQRGYQNLSRLVSEGFIRGYYYRPRVDYKLLAKHSEGLIALSACLSGDLPKLLLDGRENEARAMAQRYIDIFGKDNYFIELQDHGLPDQRTVNPRLVRLAREMDIPLVCTNDCHYLTREDAAAQEVLMCIQTGKTLSDEHRMRMDTDQMYVKSEDEMRALFPNFADAIERTEQIARRCQVEFDFSTTHLPAFPLPAGKTDKGYLRELCEDGLMRKYGPDRPDARARMEYELGVIESMGYVDYFLIVWDFIHYAKTHGVGVGPGRGSGAGSIVAYALDITEIDPLKYALVFERFLNPERISMPDIDCDFDYERRGKVIDYVRQRYGADHVAQIITFGTMAARAVIRDVGRVMDMSYQEVDAIAKMVPYELNMTLDKALRMNAELRGVYENDPNVHRLIEMARRLEGMPRNASTHAAGVLITARPVVDYCPLQTNDDVITTQFPMGTVEALGLLKMDFLGLRTLNVIMDTIAMARDRLGADFKSEDIPLDEPGVYKMISDGDTTGIFQLESTGMTQFLTNMRPSSFEDIIAAISLYRPGPMESIPRYVAGKQNPESVSYLTPQLKPILDVTYGCMVYQEQVMQIVRDLAGYSMGRSDLVRRAMSKKKHDVMAREKEIFIHGQVDDDGNVVVPGCVRNGVSEAAATRLFDEMTAFASYAFNKSHAAAYALVAVQTAWLKLKFPAEFMAAMMNSMLGHTEKIAFYIQYCRKQDIPVLPPDVNRSLAKFTVDVSGDRKGIRFGLGAVKNLGLKAVDALVTERESGGPYKDLYDFVGRVTGGEMNKKGVESLIRCGALDELPGSRSQKLHVFEKAMDGVSRRQKSMVTGQISLFGMADSAVEAPPPPMPDMPPFDKNQLLQMEKETTGVYISGHPLDAYADQLSKLQVNARFLESLAEEAPDGGMSWDQKAVRMGGIIAEKKMKAARSGNMMAFVQLEDMYGVTEVLVFPKVYERVSHLLTQDAPVVMTGKLSVREEEAPKLLLDRVAPLADMDALDERPPRRASRSDSYGAPPSYAAPPQETPYAPRQTARQARKLYLKLTAGTREQALKILAETPGNICVMLYMADEKKTYQAPREYWVDEGYDFGALANLIGADNIVLKG